jgi:hypothetical protein
MAACAAVLFFMSRGDHSMHVTPPFDEDDPLLTALERLPVDALQVIQVLVDELLQCADDNDRRKELLGAAGSHMSAPHSV